MKEVRRSGASMRLLVQLGVDLGADAQDLLHGSAVSKSALADPSLEVLPHQEQRVIHNLVKLCGHVPGLGLLAGERYHLTTYGIWGFALISSPTLGSAIQTGLRFLDLTFAFADVSLQTAHDEVRLILEDRHLPESIREFVVQRDSAALQTIVNELFSMSLPLKAMRFRARAPSDVGMYEKVFGIKAEFGYRYNEAVFDPIYLTMPLPQANASTAKMCEEQCHQLLDQRMQRGGLSARVRNRLVSAPGRIPGMESLAREFHMTERTLRRHLADEGVSYRELVAEVRQTLAEALLTKAGLSIEEISDRLGYAEPSAFIHAFRRWRGCSPSQFFNLASHERQQQKPG